MDWSSMRKYSFFALLVLVLTAANAWAQSGTTSLHGTVTDKSGASVSGAKIALTNPDLSITREATSGSEGEYKLISLPPGTYTLTVDAAGFRTNYGFDLHQLRTSTGISVQWLAPLGLFRFSLAMPINYQTGDWKHYGDQTEIFQFSIGNSF